MTVQKETKSKIDYRPLWLGLLFGIIFGFLLQKGGATKYDVILGQLLLRDFTVLKIMMSAVLVGMPGVFIMKKLGLIEFEIKFGSLGKNVIGGLLFGLGFALLGFCPGTIAGAVGNGYLDATVGGLIGIVIGSGLFAAVFPKVRNGILQWGDYGQLTLPQLLKVNEWVVIVPLSGLIIALFVVLEMNGL
jgi:uncharacterized membrane protein YedE/YeeE